MADLRLSAETNHVTTFNGNERLRVCDDPAGTPATGYLEFADLFPGYIRENSAQLLYVGAAAYSVLPGAAIVNGVVLSWGSNIARTSLSLSANTLYYVYLYSNSGTAAVEESTTVPVWDSALNYYKKTGDASRRCIGWIETNASPAIRNFICVASGRNLEIIYTDGASNDKLVVSGGSSTAAWASFTLAPFVPAHATHVYALMKIVGTTLGDDGVVSLSAIDLGAGVAANVGSYNYVRSRASAANANVFFGSNFAAIATSQTMYYRLYIVSGTPTVNIEAHGARIIR